MHTQVKEYCESVKAKHPEYFKDKNVLDVWSLDINGNNRYLFEDCEYIGIDLWEWPNVDIVCDITKNEAFEKIWTYDVVISTEMLEHCKEYSIALKQMAISTKNWGLLIFTAAWEWRPEHGTTRSDPKSAPFTNDHYKNILESDIMEALDPDNNFSEWEISKKNADIRFYWIKK